MKREEIMRRIAKTHPRLACLDSRIKLGISNAFVQFDEIHQRIIAIPMRLGLFDSSRAPTCHANEELALAIAVGVQKLCLCRIGQV